MDFMVVPNFFSGIIKNSCFFYSEALSNLMGQKKCPIIINFSPPYV